MEKPKEVLIATKFVERQPINFQPWTEKTSISVREVGGPAGPSWCVIDYSLADHLFVGGIVKFGLTVGHLPFPDKEAALNAITIVEFFPKTPQPRHFPNSIHISGIQNHPKWIGDGKIHQLTGTFPERTALLSFPSAEEALKVLSQLPYQRKIQHSWLKLGPRHYQGLIESLL